MRSILNSGRWSALALIVTAQFMVILDVAIVNVALPSIKADLGFSQTSLQWVISAYALVFGGTLLLGGRLADLLGRRRMFIAGLTLFAVSSLLCGLAWSEASLIALSCPAGARRRSARARGAFAADDDLRRGPRSQRRARGLRSRLGKRRGSRRPPRRRAHLLSELVVDLLHQRARRRRSNRAHAAAPAREPGRASPSPLRLPRGRLDHVRPDAARLCDDARDQRRLGLPRDAPAACRLRGARRSRSSRSSSAPSRRSCRCGSSGCGRCRPRTRRWRSSAPSRSPSSSC